MKFIKAIASIGICFLLISGTIDLNDLFPYAQQEVPVYINKDNTDGNVITDMGATLGRVLFYDKKLSANEAVACASCHLQEFALGDTALVSRGLHGGGTGRHAMRLVNARFSNEVRFFWDERADVLEDQTTMPIRDHVEMGYSGENADPGIEDLILKLDATEYYPELFERAFGDREISEERIGAALAQFVRSIQSFDTKFDAGLAMVNNLNQPFPNYTPQENAGKAIFVNPPNLGGAGCQGCHRAPEFDIDPATLNNGVIGVAGDPVGTDLTNTRAPSLRNLFRPDGSENGPFMHDGSMASLLDVVNHYDHIVFNPQVNPLLDPRLRGAPPGLGQQLNLTDTEKQNLLAFLRTLSGEHLYVEEAYSDPFGTDGSIDILGLTTAVSETQLPEISVSPNPVISSIQVSGPEKYYTVTITDLNGRMVRNDSGAGAISLDIRDIPSGIYVVNALVEGVVVATNKIVKVNN